MSDFVMGARLELTDDFSANMSAASQQVREFQNSLQGLSTGANAATQSINNATQSFSAMGAEAEAIEEISNTTQEAADNIQDMVQPAQEAADNMNKWQTAINNFNSGFQRIRQLPSTLREIASTRLQGLATSFTDLRTRAGEFTSNLRTMARTRITSLTSSFRTFQTTVSEGKTGLSGLATSIKNIGKISLSSAIGGFKNLATTAKNFASTKLDHIKTAISNMGGPAGIAKTAFSGMATGLKKVAQVSLSGLHAGLTKVGSLAKDAAGKIASGIGNTAVTAVKGLTGALTAAMGAVGGVVGASVKVGKSFEAGMSSVASISGATGDDFKALQDKAKEMGATTSFSATEAASAMEYMAMAGWKTKEMVGGIDGIMNLAAASGSDLATTSDIVTDAITAFGKKAKDSSNFADVMAAASSNANTNVELMGETFKYVGAAAGAMNYSIEDMAVATGLMANAGIKGSQAGTALRSTITRMAKPTKESQAAMDTLGVSLTDSQGNMKSFGDIMADMRKGMSTLTEDEKASYAAMLGGQEAMSGLLAIVNASDADFEKLTSAIENSTGAAKEMADIKLDNLEGDITILKSGLEGLGIEIYEGINAPLRGAAQMATEMVGDLSKAFKKGGFEGLVGEFGNVLGKITTKIAEYAPKVVDMGVTLIDSLLTGINENMASIGGGASSAVTSFVGGIVKLFPKLILTGVNLLTEIAKGIAKELPKLGKTGKSSIGELVQGLKSAVPSLLTAGGEILSYFVSAVVSNLPQVLQTGIDLVMSLINGAGSALPSILETATQIIATLIQGIASNLPQVLQTGVSVLMNLADGLLQNLPTLLEVALQAILTIVQGLLDNIPMILDAAVQLVQGLVQGLVSMLPQIIEAAIQLITTLAQGIIQNLPQIVQSAIEIVLSLIGGLISAIPQLIAAIPQLISAIIDTIMSTDWLSVGADIIKGIGSGLLNGVKAIGGMIADACSSIKDGITSFFGINSPSRLMKDLVGTNMALGISEGFSDTMEANATEMAKAVPKDFSTNTSLAVDTDTSSLDNLNATAALSTDTSALDNPNIVATLDTDTSVLDNLNATAALSTDTSALDNLNTVASVDASGSSDTAINAYGNVPVSPSGAVGTNTTTNTSDVRVTVEKIVLEDVGDKDPKKLVNEIMDALYEALSGADGVSSNGELGALL